LGLFGFAAIKLKPSVNSIYSSVLSVRFGIKSLYNIASYNAIDFYKTKQISLGQKIDEINGLESIEIKNLNFAYSPEKSVFKDFNLQIRLNGIVGLVGESGKGKTTLINIIAGLLEPE